ncbi:hypothetical protein ID866_8772 [Astraeus odoratus]|nr:hypothetical protein ID866_8772 [Astraeus odoratus]
MFYHSNPMCPYKCLFCFAIVALPIVSAYPTHLGIAKMPFARVWGPKRTNALTRNNIALEKRDEFRVDTTQIDNVIVDTGSSYTWVGGNPKKPYVQGPAGENLNQPNQERYTTGAYGGWAFSDDITFEAVGGAIYTINSQSIGVASYAAGLPSSEIDGILGLGRVGGSSVRDRNGNPIPTVLDNLYSQGTISSAVLGIYCVPRNNGGFGHIIFGGYSSAVTTSSVSYVPITSTLPAGSNWGVDAYFKYGGRTILRPTSGIVDTGANSICLPNEAFMAYQEAIGTSQFNDQGWLVISRDQYENLLPLSVFIGGQSYDLSPNAQILPRYVNDPWILLVVRNTDKPSGLGKDFVLGHPFIQRYYVVFNQTSSQIGFARTFFTDILSN